MADDVEALLLKNVCREDRSGLQISVSGLSSILPPVVALRLVQAGSLAGIITAESLDGFYSTSFRFRENGIDETVLKIKPHIRMIDKNSRHQYCIR